VLSALPSGHREFPNASKRFCGAGTWKAASVSAILTIVWMDSCFFAGEGSAMPMLLARGRAARLAALLAIATGSIAAAGVIEVSPYPILAGQDVTIAYDPAGRVLDGAAQVYIHHGINGWNAVPPTDPPMTWNASAQVWGNHPTGCPATRRSSTWCSTTEPVLGITTRSRLARIRHRGAAARRGSSTGRRTTTRFISRATGATHSTRVSRATPVRGRPRATGGNDHFISCPTGRQPGARAVGQGRCGGQWSAYIGNE
jgi:hypothetical protein